MIGVTPELFISIIIPVGTTFFAVITTAAATFWVSSKRQQIATLNGLLAEIEWNQIIAQRQVGYAWENYELTSESSVRQLRHTRLLSTDAYERAMSDGSLGTTTADTQSLLQAHYSHVRAINGQVSRVQEVTLEDFKKA